MVSLLARLPRRGGADAAARGSLPPAVLAALAGATVLTTALVGLSAAIVVVQTLDPSGALSVGGCVVLAGRLLLLAGGGELRTGAGPIVLAPLVLTAGLAWGLSRAARLVVRARDLTELRPVARVAGLVVAVHLLLTVLLAAAVGGSSAEVGWPRTVAGAVVLGVLAAGWGAGRESGLCDEGLDRLPGPTRPVLRAVLAGLLAAGALCTLIVAVALASDVDGYAALSRSLGGGAGGAVGLLGLGALLLPNAAAAVLGLASGPGFSVGAATLVSVHGVTLGSVPALPLLAALPDTQAVPLLAFVSQAVPALAGLVAGTALGRWLSDDDGGSLVAGLCGLLAGVGLGLGGGVLVAVAGGSLGDGMLAHVGAPVLETALAFAAQTGVAAALAAAVTRWRSLG